MYADDYIVIMSGNPAVAKKKLDGIMESMNLTMNTETTRIVKAEDGFDFLGFHFVRHYAVRSGKRTTGWFPSERSKWKIKETIRNITNRRNLSAVTLRRVRKSSFPFLPDGETTLHTAQYQKNFTRYGTMPKTCLCICIADSTTYREDGGMKT